MFFDYNIINSDLRGNEMINAENIIVLHNNKQGKKINILSDEFLKELKNVIKSETEIIVNKYIQLNN